MVAMGGDARLPQACLSFFEFVPDAAGESTRPPKKVFLGVHSSADSTSTVWYQTPPLLTSSPTTTIILSQAAASGRGETVWSVHE